MRTLIFAMMAVVIAATGEYATEPGDDNPGAENVEVVGAEMIPKLWAEIDELINEQKFEQASKKVATVRVSARVAGMAEDWTKALVRETQLRMALHGYETAVRFLKDEPWPAEPLWRATLNLFYGYALTTYIDVYSWEINQREKVISSGEVDLRAWTREEIFNEAVNAYLAVWSMRESLGDKTVSVLDEYVDPNTYPKEVRGTLRDAVSYLFVELLGNTTNWRPEHNNQLYTLDLEGLLHGNIGEAGSEDLADPALHPLKKICMILDDLEQWSWKQDRLEAALEARLERYRRLWGSFTDSRDRIRIRGDLQKRLADFRDLSWWSEGMAQLAQFVKEEDDPKSFVRAHSIAERGYKAYPESIGGKHCFSIMKGIEAPSYTMTAMESDGIGKRSLEIRHKNLASLFFRAYPIDLLALISSAKDWNLLPQGNEISALMEKRDPVVSWALDLPETPDYREHRTFATPPLDAHGCYIIISSANEEFGGDDNRLLAAPMIMTDLVILGRPDGAGGHEARVVSGSSGKPVAGATVTLYQRDWQKGHHPLEQRTTDAEGLVQFISRQDQRSGHKFLLAQKGKDLALDDTSLWFREEPKPQETTASLIYTDRSVYRPQQEVLWKVIVYRGRHDLGRFATFADATVTVSLIDPNNQSVETKTITTNRYGSASGEFTIPAGRPLGSWRLESSHSGRQSVRVEEYKRPTFEASFKDAKEPLRLNKPATLTGEARYYFGLPVVNGSVTWRVTREPVFPYWWYWWWGGRGPTARTQTVAAGMTKLIEDGTFEIQFTPEADERLAETSKETSYRFVVTATVTDEGGETREASRSFRLGFLSVEARINMAKGFTLDDTAVELTINRTNLDGVGRAGKGHWQLFSLKEPETTVLPADEPLPEIGTADEEAYKTSGDAERPRWDTSYTPERTMRGWPTHKELNDGSVEHNEAGMATVNLGALPPGPYRLAYETIDDFGEVCKTSHEFLVVSRTTVLKLPALFRVESGSVPVGGTARVLALSGLPDQLLFVDIFRAGKISERLVIEAGSEAQLIEIPVTEDDRGGFGMTLTAVRDHQFFQFSQAIYVPWDNKDLQVSFVTFRDKIRPGSHETWSVTVKGADGAAVDRGTAELLAYMYDKSLDIFAPHSPPNPRSLYPSKTGISFTRATLGSVTGRSFDRSRFASLPGYPSLIGDRLKFYSGYGIGGPGRRGMYREQAMPMAAMPVSEAKMAAESSEESMADASTLGYSKAHEGRQEEADRTIGTGEEAGEALRSDFAETAFWEPYLLLGAEGSASIQFDVPDPLTSWNVWVHAVTTDLKAGSIHREAASVKELMVRPYVPRFLREGDKAEIKVVVNNAADRTLKGTLTLDIIDPQTNESLLEEFGITEVKAATAAFEVKPQGGTNLSFPLTTPKRVGMVAFKVVATAGNLSDGELRPLPILPSRVHLIQSRFVTLRHKDKRVLRFEDLAEGVDPTRINDQMVITVDAQLFYTVLQALPYLINYPYECTEQTLNRFVSTGIVSTLYVDYPAIARMAEEFSKRKTRFETFDQADPNRRMALEETPWLEMAKGGRENADDLINVLDPRIAKANRDAAIAKLGKAQTSLGAFPWFPGGPPSPYMTLYIMHGLAKAMEFGVDVPEDIVRQGWSYLARYYREKVHEMMADDCCWEFLTFLNYVASCYDDISWTGEMLTAEERVLILDFSFKHWKAHSPYLKGYLALTLKRMDREQDAYLVWESVMDAAKTTDDQGTFWAPEDRAWLWYNDTIETHAFALRTLTELRPSDPQRDGLVQWLLLNKKLNHWKSTKATAEVIYSLVHYLEAEGALGITEDATVTVGNQTVTFTFEPDQYTGKKNQIVVPGEKVGPETAEVVVEKESKGFVFASATWHFSTEELPEEERGDFFRVSRKYFKREHTGREYVLRPLAEGEGIAVGDQIEVQISLSAKHRAEYVHLRDPRAAGLEPENQISRHKWDLGISWYEETRDSGSNFFFESLPVGEYTFTYRLRANMAGTFRVGPATVQSMYAPEFNAYSSGAVITVKEGE